MNTKILALALSVAALLPATAARAQDDEVSFEVFYDNLSPMGEWIEVGDYGTCWRPHNVDADWAPYTDGYWSYTDAGWTWVSYEDFGSITYHYGRWVDVDDTGWCWVPDYEWGPAWVSWRQNDDYVGWAPLPPEATFRVDVGVSDWADDYYDIGPSYYNFCPVADFGAPVIASVCVPRVQVFGIFGRCRNITNISWNSYNRVPFCGGPDILVINRFAHHRIPTLKLVRNTTIVNNNVTIINNRRVVNFRRANVRGNTLNVFAPKIVNKTNNNTAIIKPKITKVVKKDKVNRGWRDATTNQGELASLRARVKDEAKGRGPKNAPARPVKTADLKPLPEKADPDAPSAVADRGNRRERTRQNPGGNADNEKTTNGAVADRPNRGNRPDGDGPNNKGDRPNAGGGDKPNRVGMQDNDRPNRGDGDGANKPGKGNGPAARVGTDKDDRPNRPGADGGKDKPDRPNAGGGENRLTKPFRGNNDNDDRKERPRIAPEGGNRNPARERDNDGAAAMRKRVEQQANENAQRQQAERRSQQAEAQRNMQRNAEAQQRQIQQQRAQQMQRQMQQQRAQQMQRQIQQQQIQRQQPQFQGGGQGQGQGGRRGEGRGRNQEENEKRNRKN